MAIHMTTAAANQPLAKSNTNIAPLLCMKGLPCFSATTSRRRLADQLCTFPLPDHNGVKQGNGVE
jgi:hypothetical protein